MQILAILVLLFSHWVGDFVLQTDEMATQKSKNNWALVKHTLVYSLTITIVSGLLYLFNFFGAQYWWEVLLFGLIQFVSHTLIDFVTSRMNAYYWVNEKRHQFFTNIGFDQFLHSLVLILSLYYIFYY